MGLLSWMSRIYKDILFKINPFYIEILLSCSIYPLISLWITSYIKERDSAPRKKTNTSWTCFPGEEVATVTVDAPCGQASEAIGQVADATEELEQLSQQLKRPLPEPAKTMLQNSLTLWF